MAICGGYLLFDQHVHVGILFSLQVCTKDLELSHFLFISRFAGSACLSSLIKLDRECGYAGGIKDGGGEGPLICTLSAEATSPSCSKQTRELGHFATHIWHAIFYL